MNNLFKNFIGMVMITALVIDLELKTFSCQMLIKDADGDQRKGYKGIGEFSGRMSQSVYNFFTKVLVRYQMDENGHFPVDDKGNRVYNKIGNETGLEKYLRVNGIEFDIENFNESLKNVKFVSNNKSEKFWENPFKLLIDNKVNDSMLKMVYEYPARKVVTRDPVKNETKVTWYPQTFVDANGNTRRKTFKPGEYLRIVNLNPKEIMAES